MTAEELRAKFNNEFGLGEWPKTYEVDAETYANCCQFVFDKIADNIDWGPIYEIALGPNKGLMFKNVELILKR